MNRKLICEFAFLPGDVVRHRLGAANSVYGACAVGIVVSAILHVRHSNVDRCSYSILYDVQWPSPHDDGLPGDESRHYEHELTAADPDSPPDSHTHHTAAPSPSR